MHKRTKFYKKFGPFLTRYFIYIITIFHLSYSISPVLNSLYFLLVAIPPLICLSALFSSNISLTSLARPGFIFNNLSLTSLCTDVTFCNGSVFVVSTICVVCIIFIIFVIYIIEVVFVIFAFINILEPC